MKNAYCESCGNKAELVCKGCSVSTYCNKECQQRAWKHDHKQQCPILAKCSDEELSNDPKHELIGIFGKFKRKRRRKKGCKQACGRDRRCRKDCERSAKQCERNCGRGRRGKECRRNCRDRAAQQAGQRGGAMGSFRDDDSSYDY